MHSHTVRRRMKAIVADIANLEPCGRSPFFFSLFAFAPRPCPRFAMTSLFIGSRLLPVQRLPPAGPGSRANNEMVELRPFASLGWGSIVSLLQNSNSVASVKWKRTLRRRG